MAQTKPENETFAVRLKAFRKEAGLTQQDIATALGLDRSTYTYYERGKTRPNWETLQRLAAIFQVPMTSLWGGDRSFRPIVRDNPLQLEPTSQRLADLTPEERQLLLQFRQLDGEARFELIAHLKDLLG